MAVQAVLPGFGEAVEIKEGRSAYPALPGTGPEGEICKTCKHSWYHEHSKRYWKCGLVQATHGSGTDIRIKGPACRFWEKKR
ncbi:hypothetical protein [Candidatus Vondammii sp. HM_W22]|uniref:hypothetical protein n=1 Tax=Candidatus Vondammii sp. HM_W22 TaxID=2687299 RepID=UPI002E7C3E74|nr:hypothetical protein [Candidatus Vondammii sp. HM_W22]